MVTWIDLAHVSFEKLMDSLRDLINGRPLSFPSRWIRDKTMDGDFKRQGIINVRAP